eukprot:15102502-Alexandrium_andersonii.AAC.1
MAKESQARELKGHEINLDASNRGWPTKTVESPTKRAGASARRGRLPTRRRPDATWSDAPVG